MYFIEAIFGLTAGKSCSFNRVEQATNLEHNVGCAMLFCYFIDRVFPCVVWLNFQFIECPLELYF